MCNFLLPVSEIVPPFPPLEGRTGGHLRARARVEKFVKFRTSKSSRNLYGITASRDKRIHFLLDKRLWEWKKPQDSPPGQILETDRRPGRSRGLDLVAWTQRSRHEPCDLLSTRETNMDLGQGRSQSLVSSPFSQLLVAEAKTGTAYSLRPPVIEHCFALNSDTTFHRWCQNRLPLAISPRAQKKKRANSSRSKWH